MKRLRPKTSAVASLVLFAAALSGCADEFSPRLEYSTKSPNGKKTAFVAVEPNWWHSGIMSVVFEPPEQKRDTPWGEIEVIYHAKLGWLDDTTFLIVSDELVYGQRTGNEYSFGDYPGPVTLVTCVRKKRDCSVLENELKPNALYVQNFQSGLATYEEQTDGKPVVRVLPPTPASSP